MNIRIHCASREAPQMFVRLAQPEDYQSVVDFRRQHSLPALPVRGITAEMRNQVLLDGYARYWKWVGKDPNFHALLCLEDDNQIVGLLLLVNGASDSITDQPQGILLDFAMGNPQAGNLLLEAAEAAGRQGKMDFIVGDVSVDTPEVEQLLEQRNYQPDLNRIILLTKNAPALEEKWKVRGAQSTDYFFILSLNSQVNSNTIPPGRDADPLLVARGYLQAYSALKVGSDPKMPTWIAEDDGTPIGYLMIKLGAPDPLSGWGTGYIYEIAVHPDYWGKRVVHALLGAALTQLHTEQVIWVTGDISQSNIRAFKTAQRQFKFTLEVRRWMIDLRPKNSSSEQTATGENR